MNSKYIKLTTKYYVILEFIALSPILIVIVFYGILKSCLLACVFFQLITLTLMPCFFIDVLLSDNELYSDSDTKIEAFFSSLFNNIKGQFMRSSLIIVLIFSAVGLVYYVIYNVYPEIFLMIHIPFADNMLNYISLIVLLGFSNPWLEEWFWRVFLIRFYPDTELWRMVTTFHYAIYHLFVLFFLFHEWILSFLGFLGIFIFGRFFLFLNSKYGFIVSGMTHMTCNISVVVMAFVVIYQ